MNMFKKNGGFTLVELIVVIAILAILAAVAVPAYSGYISKANEAADLTQLDAIKTAASFAAIDKDADHNLTVSKIFVTVNTAEGGAKTITVKVNAESGSESVDVSTEIGTYYNFPSTGFKSEKFAGGAKWEGADWVKYPTT